MCPLLNCFENYVSYHYLDVFSINYGFYLKRYRNKKLLKNQSPQMLYTLYCLGCVGGSNVGKGML